MHHRSFSVPLALLLFCATAHAARPQSWTFASQKDFAQGRFENLVVNSYGELALGRPLTPVPLDHAGENISAFAQTPDGALYVATSPEAAIFKIDNHKTTQVFKAPKGFEDITAMAADAQGNLFVALSGETAKLISINPATPDATPTTRFQNPDVSYIWALAQAPDGTLYLGTGPHGKIYALAPHADPAVYLDTPQKNITALVFDKANNLVAGTDAHGLVFRIDAHSKKPFVLLDAGKVDINALATDPAGNLYVATAKTDLADSMGSGLGDEPEIKGKPSTPEPEPMDPPQEERNKAGAFAPLPFSPILGAAPTDIPPELKALLKKAAADSGKQDGKPTKPHPDTLPAHRAKPHPKPSHAEDSDDQPDGTSAVLRITPDGLATTLVQDQGNNYALLVSGDELLVGTGDEGKLFAYSLADQSLSLISRVKEQQVSTLFAAKDGTLFVGTGNMAQVYQMPKAPASTGTFTSQVLDAAHQANFGHALADTTAIDGAKVTIATRTGNTQDVLANAPFWSDWADLGDASKIASPPARYLQVRITLAANTQGASPTLSNLRLAYQTQNLAPRLKKVAVELPGNAGSPDENADPDMAAGTDESSTDKLAHVSWDATDPNGDSLLARLYYKPLTTTPNEPWTLFARDQKDTPYDWDTKSIPDGKYQVKVVVSDSPDNPAADALEAARTSSTITIDHTPPILSDLTATIDGNKATLTGSAKDALSPVTDVRYQVDGQNNAEDWQPAAASDKIFDSPQEAFTLVTRPLSAGAHRITVRATDASGNSSYKALTIIVKS